MPLHNNSKARRERRDATRVRGPRGTPHPQGNRAWRRGDEAKQQAAMIAKKLAAALGRAA